MKWQKFLILFIRSAPEVGRTEIFLKLEQNLFSISNVELDHIFKFFHLLKFLYFVKIFFPKFLHIWKKFSEILTLLEKFL